MRYSTKLMILVLLAVSATGFTRCNPESARVDVSAAQDARSSEAAAAVSAAREINTLQPESRTTDVVEKELEVAQANLPLPTAEQKEKALARANQALRADNETLRNLYNRAIDDAAILVKELEKAREEAARAAENEKARREALLMQTRITTWASIGFFAAGAVIGLVLKNVRLGIVTALIGGILLGASRMLSTVPQWAYTVLFITTGIVCIIAPILMWWGYKTGLFQKPPQQVGEYKLTDA